jgi:uncharacterized protein
MFIEEMTTLTQTEAPRKASKIIVHDSPVHGKGVFAARDISAGTRLVEYKGELITAREAERRENLKPADCFHTFFFSLESGKIIDGGRFGNNARWINHSCEPNCEAREEDGRVFIYSLRDLKAGEELNYDYGLILEQRHTPAIKKAYECRCGAKTCRGTLLAPKRRKKVG